MITHNVWQLCEGRGSGMFVRVCPRESPPGLSAGDTPPFAKLLVSGSLFTVFLLYFLLKALLFHLLRFLKFARNSFAVEIEFSLLNFYR